MTKRGRLDIATALGTLAGKTVKRWRNLGIPAREYSTRAMSVALVLFGVLLRSRISAATAFLIIGFAGLIISRIWYETRDEYDDHI